LGITPVWINSHMS